jgi:hypothetical protein
MAFIRTQPSRQSSLQRLMYMVSPNASFQLLWDTRKPGQVPGKEVIRLWEEEGGGIGGLAARWGPHGRSRKSSITNNKRIVSTLGIECKTHLSGCMIYCAKEVSAKAMLRSNLTSTSRNVRHDPRQPSLRLGTGMLTRHRSCNIQKILMKSDQFSMLALLAIEPKRYSLLREG